MQSFSYLKTPLIRPSSSLNVKKILAVINATYAVAKRKPATATA